MIWRLLILIILVGCFTPTRGPKDFNHRGMTLVDSFKVKGGTVYVFKDLSWNEGKSDTFYLKDNK
jgi:hypothetical protein